MMREADQLDKAFAFDLGHFKEQLLEAIEKDNIAVRRQLCELQQGVQTLLLHIVESGAMRAPSGDSGRSRSKAPSRDSGSITLDDSKGSTSEALTGYPDAGASANPPQDHNKVDDQDIPINMLPSMGSKDSKKVDDQDIPIRMLPSLGSEDSKKVDDQDIPIRMLPSLGSEETRQDSSNSLVLSMRQAPKRLRSLSAPVEDQAGDGGLPNQPHLSGAPFYLAAGMGDWGSKTNSNTDYRVTAPAVMDPIDDTEWLSDGDDGRTSRQRTGDRPEAHSSRFSPAYLNLEENASAPTLVRDVLGKRMNSEDSLELVTGTPWRLPTLSEDTAKERGGPVATSDSESSNKHMSPRGVQSLSTSFGEYVTSSQDGNPLQYKHRRKRGRKLDRGRFATEPSGLGQDTRGSPRSSTPIALFSSSSRVPSPARRGTKESAWTSVTPSEMPSRPRGKTNATINSIESTYSSQSSVRHKTCEALRLEHDQELMKDAEERGSIGFHDPFDYIPEEGSVASLSTLRAPQEATRCTKEQAGKIVAEIIPRVIGMLPWTTRFPRCSWVYQLGAVAVTTVLLVATSIRALVKFLDGQGDLIHTLDVLSSLGCTLGLVASGVLVGSKPLLQAESAIHSYAASCQLLSRWGSWSSLDLAVSFAVWVAIVATRIFAFEVQSMSEFFVEGGTFSFCALISVGIVSYIIHLCRGLNTIVDHFCQQVVDQENFSGAVREWNRVQAMCRGASVALQYCFVLLLSLATIGALLVLSKTLFDHTFEVMLIPGLMLAAAIFRIAVWASAVTDKCMHVPQFVNALAEEDDLNQERMYAVQYILHSQAGFYVFELRLTGTTVMKAIYIACAVTIGIATQLTGSP